MEHGPSLSLSSIIIIIITITIIISSSIIIIVISNSIIIMIIIVIIITITSIILISIVKPVPIRAGLSERWWTQLVLKIWRLFPVRKRTLQQGIYNIKSEYKELIHFKIHIYHYLIRIFPRYNQHNSMSISCELMPWHQLWQQLIRRYQLTTVAEKYINQTTTVNL